MFAVQQKDVTLTRRARQLRHSARTQVVGLSLIGTERRHLDKTSKRHRCSARTQVFAQARTQVFVASPPYFPFQNHEAFPFPLRSFCRRRCYTGFVCLHVCAYACTCAPLLGTSVPSQARLLSTHRAYSSEELGVMCNLEPSHAAT